MKNFMMIFRNEKEKEREMTSPEEMQKAVKKWEDWIGGIAAQGKFIASDALGFEGKTLHSDNSITDGPYAEVKEIVGGYLICKTDTIDDAMKLAEGCPVFEVGGKVEVRDVMVFDM